jgi:stearoyl-CoA desaturase (delta-9 desaturase)
MIATASKRPNIAVADGRKRAPGQQPNLIARLLAPSFVHMQVLQLISTVAFLLALLVVDGQAQWWLVSLGAYFLTGCVGLTVTLHRALTHRAVGFPRPLEYLFTLFGVLGGTGSSIAWVAMHRAHHAFVDTPKDPHSPEKLGWKIFFSVYDYTFNPRHAGDLLRDRFHLFVHRYYSLILISWAVGLTLIDPLLMLFGFLIPAFAQITVSNLTSILTHSRGYRRFDTADRSVNNPLIALLGWGEGWHNNHHAFPKRPCFGRARWEIDAGAIVIQGLRKAHLATVTQGPS